MLREIAVNGRLLYLVYKVVTPEMQSLGLRRRPNRNPHIMTFSLDEWIAQPAGEILPGHGDYGGIWAAASMGSAHHLQKYMWKDLRRETRVFEAHVPHKNLLYFNDYRVKTSKILLTREINDDYLGKLKEQYPLRKANGTSAGRTGQNTARA